MVTDDGVEIEPAGCRGPVQSSTSAQFVAETGGSLPIQAGQQVEDGLSFEVGAIGDQHDAQ